MTTLHLSPFSILNDLDSVIQNSLSDSKEKYTPTSRINEKDEYFHLSVDIPGVDKEHLKVNIVEEDLIIAGNRNDLKDYNEGFFNFTKTYKIPKNIKLDDIEVIHLNGVLNIYLPKMMKEERKLELEIKTDTQSRFLKQ